MLAAMISNAVNPEGVYDGCGGLARCGFEWSCTRIDHVPRLKRARKASKRLVLMGFLESGGERGIRTPGRLLTYSRFPGVRFKPLSHLSLARIYSEEGGDLTQ
jgi:hypothetical protein